MTDCRTGSGHGCPLLVAMLVQPQSVAHNAASLIIRYACAGLFWIGFADGRSLLPSVSVGLVFSTTIPTETPGRR